MTFPPSLKFGDKIGIIAPSNGINDLEMENFKNGLNIIKNLGFEIVMGKYVMSKSYYFSSSPTERAFDLNSMFADKTVKAIICAKGGDCANEVLPLIDYKLVIENPKIFMGFSDITVLLNTITHLTGLVTFLGPDVVWKFGYNWSDYDENQFFEILIANQKKISPNAKNKQKWKILKESKNTNFGGNLFGGNLRCFLKLAGSKFLPRLDQSVLLVEGVKQNISWFASAFEHLDQLGMLKKINGIIIGNNYKCINDAVSDRSVEDTILELIKNKNIDANILKINEFGHNSDHSVFPIGELVTVKQNSINWS